MSDSPCESSLSAGSPILSVWTTRDNVELCSEHDCLTVAGPEFPAAAPGQFVTIAPPTAVGALLPPESNRPFYLRRAFSIAGLRRRPSGVEIDVIYRVVGAATRWMAQLRPGDGVSVAGPLGKPFPISARKRQAWLVSGGVGLPPVLWLAETVARRNKEAVAFYGAGTAAQVPLRLRSGIRVLTDATAACFCAEEFARHSVPAVLCTDDGTLGYRGNVLRAVEAFWAANPASRDELVIYACGPEPMLAGLARWCDERGLECYVCLEAEMACGTGTCQSCVVRVRSDANPDGWEYELCCTDGPVFEAKRVLWSKRASAQAEACGSE